MSQRVTGALLRYMDLLGDSTEDYYLSYDCKKDELRFSKNIEQIVDLFSGEESRCGLKDWLGIVAPMDMPKLKRLFQDLLEGKMRYFNVNYRIQDRYGNRLWVNSRAKCYTGQDGCPDYVLGRLTRHTQMGNASGTYHHDGLMQALNRCRSEGQDGFLVAIGVDGLERINVKWGRAFGDAVIKSLAESMAAAIHNVELVFRTSGDCYCALLHTSVQRDAERYFETVQRELRDQCAISGGAVSIQTYQVPESHPAVSRFRRACEKLGLPGALEPTFGGSDQSNLSLHGIQGLVLASAMEQVHSCGEYTTVSGLETVAELVKLLMQDRE